MRVYAAILAGAGGGVVWGGLLLGIWSISTAEPALLAGWWAGQTVELALGGSVIGALLGGARLRTVSWLVGAVVVASVLTAVVLQSIGYATAPIVLN